MKIYESLTLGQIIERGAAEFPNKIAVVDRQLINTYP
mgnify:CR=1 FL=1